MWTGLAYLTADKPLLVALCAVALGNSLLISFLRAWAEAAGVPGKGGLMGRASLRSCVISSHSTCRVTAPTISRLWSSAHRKGLPCGTATSGAASGYPQYGLLVFLKDSEFTT